MLCRGSGTTEPVAVETATSEPAAFVAVTSLRTVAPMSAPVST